MKQWLKEFTHNCLIHPLMMFVPQKVACSMHDRHADWCFGSDNRYDELALEKQMKKKQFTEIRTSLDELEDNYKGFSQK